MPKPTLLVVDDDRTIRQYLSDFLSTCGYNVETAESGEEALSRLSAGFSPDAMLLDVVIPGMQGPEVLAKAKKISPALPVIMVTAVDQIKTVVEAMRAGASNYITKPFLEQELELAIEQALEKKKLQEEVRTLRQQLTDFTSAGDIDSSNPAMIRVREVACAVADADVPVLILGESGVGKEVIARLIHSESKRRNGPFVKVNCAALPHDLLESELFGHERGAFTGAHTDKPGKFELAANGSILLDEIGEMSPTLQAKMLHVLQDGEFMRVGGRRNLRSDARILASTNRQLERAVKNGEFRADLYFRLNVIKLEIPPLRTRKEDLPLFCGYFVRKYRERYRSDLETLPKKLMDAFAEYSWPGNVRQLENVIKRFLILGDLEMVVSELKSDAQTAPSAPEPRSPAMPLKAVSALAAEQAEKEAILKALEETNWNRKKAAQQLGICYKALLNKLKKWHLDNRARGNQPAAPPPPLEALETIN